VTDAILAFDNELWDPDGYHDNATNNSRLTVPAGKGGTFFVLCTSWVSTNGARLEIFVNGTMVRGRGANPVTGNYGSTSALLQLSDGDYVEIMGKSFASTQYGDAGVIGDNTVFSLVKLG